MEGEVLTWDSEPGSFVDGLRGQFGVPEKMLSHVWTG